MKILTEASGSLVSGYLIKAINDSGYTSVGSDINSFNHGKCIADEFIEVPENKDPYLWEKIEEILLKNKIDIVIPSFDNTLLEWAKKKEHFKKLGILILTSPVKTIETFTDKWETYLFFKSIKIKTPKSSLSQDFKVVKPIIGRGGKGVYIGDNKINMSGMISQEFIEGTEYTIDCLFDKNGNPVYIIPRKRLSVKDGKSTKGVTVQHKKIENYIKIISMYIEFNGPINFQCIENRNKELFFIEINPRIAGGMALGFAASENWIPLLVDNFINNNDINPKKINYNLKMVRYYAECFIS